MKIAMNLALMSLSLAIVMPSAFAAKVGEPAPAFTGMDSTGKPVDLSQYKGKYVVLEWHNKDCPYVKAQYKAGTMQKLQTDWTTKGVIWLSVVSSAKGQEGAEDSKAAAADVKSTHAAVTATILDTDGKIGHAYDAKTTPHMFVIDPKGNLIYNGAIDDSNANDAAGVTAAKTNYVSLALTEAMAGKPLSQATTKPFGCSVKY